jgi:hypothetical protein
MRGIEAIGLTKEEYEKARGVAGEILQILAKDEMLVVGILTSLALVAGGVIHKLDNKDSQESLITVMQQLTRTAIKTYDFVDTSKVPEVVN